MQHLAWRPAQPAASAGELALGGARQHTRGICREPCQPAAVPQCPGRGSGGPGCGHIWMVAQLPPHRRGARRARRACKGGLGHTGAELKQVPCTGAVHPPVHGASSCLPQPPPRTLGCLLRHQQQGLEAAVAGGHAWLCAARGCRRNPAGGGQRRSAPHPLQRQVWSAGHGSTAGHPQEGQRWRAVAGAAGGRAGWHANTRGGRRRYCQDLELALQAHVGGRRQVSMQARNHGPLTETAVLQGESGLGAMDWPCGGRAASTHPGGLV